MTAIDRQALLLVYGLMLSVILAYMVSNKHWKWTLFILFIHGIYAIIENVVGRIRDKKHYRLWRASKTDELLAEIAFIKTHFGFSEYVVEYKNKAVLNVIVDFLAQLTGSLI